MNATRPIFLLVWLGLVACPLGMAGEPPPLSPQEQQADLAKIPATDPATADAPVLLDVVKGVHPRLLFSAEEMKALKEQAGTDPLLKRAYEGTRQWAQIALVPSGPRPPIVADDTSALVKSFSQAPAMAYAYALDHDPAMKQKIVATLSEMLAVEHWSDGKELDSSMGAACNMFMVALLYDAVYPDLEPAQRSQLAQKIFTQARRLYYLGHRKLANGTVGYWQADPQPNHRWYRDMGLAACVLAVADEKDIDASFLLKALKDEMDFVIKWYPPDGDCHEGAGYQSFGYTAIAVASEMMDRNLGTNYLKSSGLTNAWAQQIYYWVPGRQSDISWGDDQNGAGSDFDHNDATFFLDPRISRDPLAQAALMLSFSHADHPDKQGRPPLLPWTMLAFYDPSVPKADISSLPLARIFPDMGAASMRDSWGDDAVVFTFKCGPYGGYRLNEYRNTTLENGQPHYINVAHDDPDANEFALAAGDGFAFHPGVYSTMKVTRDHSTITVDNKGQVGEGDAYTQPVGTADMTQLSFLTGWKTDAAGRVIIEGEAGGAYRGVDGPGLKKAENRLPDPVLKTYRRTAIWMPKNYVLILDHIVGNGAHTLTWRGTTPAAQLSNLQGTVTTETGKTVGFQMAANQAVQGGVDDKLVLAGRWGNVPVHQLQVTAQTDAIKFATLLDPWGVHPQMTLAENNGVATVTIHGPDFDDTWTWHEARESLPSVIEGQRGGQPLMSLTEADKAPRN